jgi:formylglycine-generating enzyme required for sulfatase activity
LLRRDPNTDTNRLLRGGAWNNNSNNCRGSQRNNNNNPNNANNNIGFRAVSTPRLELSQVIAQE